MTAAAAVPALPANMSMPGIPRPRPLLVIRSACAWVITPSLTAWLMASS